MDQAADDFYAQGPVFDDFARLTEPVLYRPLPNDWLVGLSDVVSSTAAIAGGQYRSVNMAGAALIAALSNGLGQRDFPFAFGGDGASFAVPATDAEIARAALASTAAWVRDELGLKLRVALVPMAAIHEAGLDVRVARYAPSPHVTYAMFTGGGLAWAGSQTKAGAYAVEPAPPGTRPDLTGLACRWQEFTARHGVMLSLIAVPTAAAGDAAFDSLVGEVLQMVGRGERGREPDRRSLARLGLAGARARHRGTGEPGARRFARPAQTVAGSPRAGGPCRHEPRHLDRRLSVAAPSTRRHRQCGLPQI